MATPRAFVDPDPARLDALLDAHPFVTLITLRDGAPDASHVPVLARRENGSWCSKATGAAPIRRPVTATMS